MWFTRKEPAPDVSALVKRLADTESRLIDLQQDHRKLLRAFTDLEVEMTGLADKLARQLKRIRVRAAGGAGDSRSDDPQFPDLGEPEGDDPAVESIVARLKGARRGA